MIKYNIGVYTRISREDVTESNESLINQKNLIDMFIQKSNDLKVSNIFYYEDNGYSGSNFNRPAVERLIKDIKDNKINCVIVKDLSRFGRNYIQVSDYLDKIFPFMNVRFIAINDDYDNINNKNITSNIDISFKNLLYTYYIKDLALKSKSTKITKVKNGEYIWKVPFGYKKNPITKRLEIDEENANIIKMIFNLQNEFNSYIRVSKELNDKSIPTIRKLQNKPCKKEIWKSGDIRQIIINEVYIGNTIGFKTRKKVMGDNKKTVKNIEDDIIRLENTHPPIIDKELFLKLNSKKFNIDKSKNKKENCLFAYKIKCGCCGYALRNYYYMDNKKNTILRKYYCNSWKQNSFTNCFKGKISEEDIKIKVLDTLKEKLILNNIKENKNYDKNKIEKLILNSNNSLTRLTSKKVKIYENYLENIITKDEYLKQKKNLDNLISLENKNLKELNIQLNSIENNNKYFNFTELTKDIVDKYVKEILVYNSNEVVVKLKK